MLAALLAVLLGSREIAGIFYLAKAQERIRGIVGQEEDVEEPPPQSNPVMA